MATRSQGRSDAAGHRSRRYPAGLYTIITVKLAKGLLLLLVSLGLYALLGDDLRADLERFLRLVNVNPEGEFWAALGNHLSALTHARLQGFALGFLLYALLLAVESIGLMRRAYWAGWLAIGETGFFIPIEVLDLVKKPSWLVGGILLANALIVLYLVRNRDRLFHHHRH